RGLAGGREHVLGLVRQRRRPAPPHARQLARDCGPGGAQRDDGEEQRPPVQPPPRPAPARRQAGQRTRGAGGGRADVQRGRAHSREVTGRAGAPATVAPGGTSRVPTACGATSAPAPTSTPRRSTARPPIPQPRRSVTPLTASPAPWRPMVSSLGVT